MAAGAAAPMILHAQDKAGTRAPVLGEGAWKYEAIHDWGELPAHLKWGNTHGVVEDSQGNVYVHHTVFRDCESAETMVVFDAKGKFVRSWGKEFRGVAHRLWLRKEGNQEFLYLTVNSANSRMPVKPEMSSVMVKAAQGARWSGRFRGRWRSMPTSLRRMGVPRRIIRRTLQSRRTAIFMSATDTVLIKLISTTTRRITSAPSAARDRNPAS
jgi:hypothetical protein